MRGLSEHYEVCLDHAKYWEELKGINKVSVLTQSYIREDVMIDQILQTSCGTPTKVGKKYRKVALACCKERAT